MRRNLELKAADPDPPATRAAALALPGVEDAGVLRQRDTYFFAVQGRLKLRETDGAAAELVAYARPDRPEPRVSRFHVVPVVDPAGTAEALGDVLGVRAVVEKERRLLLWRGVRVHLDRVARLGAFVELEAPLGIGEEEARVAELRAALGLRDELLVPRGYAELLGAI